MDIVGYPSVYLSVIYVCMYLPTYTHIHIYYTYVDARALESQPEVRKPSSAQSLRRPCASCSKSLVRGLLLRGGGGGSHYYAVVTVFIFLGL